MALTKQQILSFAGYAKALDVELAALAAVVEVETNGVIFARVGSRDLPVIRWEGHYFHRLLKEPKRTQAVKAGLASPQAQAVKNPSSQSKRYEMLDQAARIDQEAAYSSISIGVGQVMGEHAKRLGFTSAFDMFKKAATGLEGQVSIMAAFIKSAGLVTHLKRRDWSAFARGYNGKNYRQNRYDEKMGAAYTRALSALGQNAVAPTENPNGMLRLGSKGAEVRDVQALLNRALKSPTLNVDGDFGPQTETVVRSFQSRLGITSEGVVGPQTRKALEAYRNSNEDALGEPSLIEVPEVPKAAGTGAGGVTVVVAADKVNEVAEKIGGSGPIMDNIANGLYILGAILIVAGVAWGVWGYLKSKRTFEGTAT